MDLGDIREELFRLEYPYLHPGSDPDIERYCYLRGSGQGRDALNIYQFRIKPRYPDDTLRMALLRTYRAMDPLFPRLLAVGYRRLAERALERVRGIIDYISGKIKTYKKQDVYSTIKTIEDILRFFPREQYEAVSGIDRMYRYAQVMNHQVQAMEQAAELVRSYLSQSLSILEDERKRRLREQNRRTREAKAPLVDFSTVQFSEADLKRIEIPGRLSRLEDQALAYCLKYWNLVNDASFEQILFLYSRKFGRKNHSVYLAIRRGRNANYRDEDILTGVMSMLVTGYYYSIQGDRYLQRSWQAIKNTMDRAALAAKNAASVAAAAPAKTAAPAKVASPVKAAAPAKIASPAKAAAPARAASPARAAAPAKIASPAKAAASAKAAAPAKIASPAKAAAPARAASPAKAAAPAKIASPARAAAPAKIASPAKAAPNPAAPLPAGGSVSDRLRSLSGRSYDLYQERFLAQARPAIRKVLGLGRGIFFSLPEQAEDLVYSYLRDHYADPYMNWPESPERRTLKEQGFELPSLNPVIDECFRMINRE
ncbi:MAG: hypothetical protein LBQ55_08400 [Treponema sp.]|jgi:hypothetical protein|nr:hypothetical protein [Treponema sp.]